MQHSSSAHCPYISVVVPVYNESESIQKLDFEIRSAVSTIDPQFELIYINDGSTDGTIDVLRKLPHAKIIDLNRNYGQATALDAGFKAAQGQYIVSLDADGQNDPADILALMQELVRGKYDVVAGWRKKRKDTGGIRFLTNTGRMLRRFLISDIVHDTGCTLRVYKRAAVQSLDIGGEMHRYILALLRWKGFRIGEVVVNHRVREFGVSKYGMSKAIRGLIDLIYIWFIYKYSQRPLHLFGYLAAGSTVFSLAAAAWAIYGKLEFGLSLNRNGWFFLSFFFLLAAIMLFSFGIIIDLLIRIQLTSSPHEKRYYIREIICT